jgi:putative spermidine/putrescine transport system substrate-binding protein
MRILQVIPRGRGEEMRVRSVRLVALLVVFVFVAAACSDDGGDGDNGTTGPAAEGLAAEYQRLCPPDEAPDTMVLGLWGGQQSQLVLTGLQDFMDATGVEVVTTEDGSSDRVAKLRAEVGAQSIDVAVIPDNEVAPLLAEGAILPEDTSIPNYENLADVAKIPGGYGTSLLAGVIAYNPEFVTEVPDSYLDLLDPKYSGHVAISSIPGAPGYALLSMIAREMGGSEDDLLPAIEALGEISDGIAYIYDFGPAVVPLVLSGDVWIFAGIAGQVQAMIQSDVPLAIATSEAGLPAMMNVAVIGDGVQHEGCSKALVSAILSPAVQSRYIEVYYYAPTVTNVSVPPAFAKDVYPRSEDTLVDLDEEAINAKAPDYVDAFNRLVVGA